MANAKNRTKSIIAHTSPARHQFLRERAAKNGMTISTFVETILTDVLSKVDDPNNPFLNAQNKQ